MPAAPKHRQSIVDAAVALFRRQGYAATGLAQILQVSGAPKGSLYHYFPDGKAQIGAEAVATAGRTVATTLRELAEETDGPAALVAAYLDLVDSWMRESDFHDGSPITTTLLEMAPSDEPIRAAGEEAHASWIDVIATAGVGAGLDSDRATAFAQFALAAVDGALVQCRVSGDGAPLDNAARQLERLAEAFDAA